MQRNPVASKLLKSVGYDPAKKVLEVEFISSGKVYQYTDVKQETFDEMMSAKSIGSFFLKQVKPIFQATRIEDKDASSQSTETPAAPSTATEDSDISFE